MSRRQKPHDIREQNGIHERCSGNKQERLAPIRPVSVAAHADVHVAFLSLVATEDDGSSIPVGLVPSDRAYTFYRHPIDGSGLGDGLNDLNCEHDGQVTSDNGIDLIAMSCPEKKKAHLLCNDNGQIFFFARGMRVSLLRYRE